MLLNITMEVIAHKFYLAGFKLRKSWKRLIIHGTLLSCVNQGVRKLNEWITVWWSYTKAVPFEQGAGGWNGRGEGEHEYQGWANKCRNTTFGHIKKTLVNGFFLIFWEMSNFNFKLRKGPMCVCVWSCFRILKIVCHQFNFQSLRILSF